MMIVVLLLGQEAAELVTKKFVSPIKLEFEKVFCPFLLMNKKRYAGLLYTNPNRYSRLDTKGIEVSNMEEKCFDYWRMVLIH